MGVSPLSPGLHGWSTLELPPCAARPSGPAAGSPERTVAGPAIQRHGFIQGQKWIEIDQ